LRNHFRSTAAHNTIAINGKEQNSFPTSTIALFAMSNEAEPTLIVADSEDSLRASHSGYHCFGVTHTRTVKFQQDRLVIIEDQLLGSGTNRLDATFNLAPGWKVVSSEASGKRAACSVQGPLTVEFTFEFSSAGLVIKFEDTKISRTFAGPLVPACRITLSGQTEFPLWLTTKIVWSETPCA
jgi:hypothetical protein